MTKYCPLCESEYQDSVANCLDDGEKLFDAPSVKIERTLSLEVYAAANEIEAACIVELLLDAGVPAQLFKPQVSAFPNLGDEHFVVCVRSADKKIATDAITSARNDGVISDAGLFL